MLPELAIVFGPPGYFAEGRGFEPAGTPLRLSALRDQAGALEDLEVFGDGGRADRERFGEFPYSGFAEGEAREDGATGGVGESGEGCAEAVVLHLLLTYRLIYLFG